MTAHDATPADVLAGNAEWALIVGDCIAGMKTLPDRCADHVITDPPYAKVVVNSVKTGPTGFLGGKRRDLGYAGVSDAARAVCGFQFARVAQRWILTFTDIESVHAWRDALEPSARYIRTGVWVSPAVTPQFTGDRPGTGFECIVIAHCRGHRKGRMRWNGGGRPAVWIVNRPTNGTEERRLTGHPSPKPLPLMEALVRDFTDHGDLILDPFAGSGTTGVAALRNGRRFIGWEKNAAYAAAARKRLTAAREQLSMEELCKRAVAHG